MISYIGESPKQSTTDLGVNTIPADALAPKVARASAGMVLLA